VNRWRKAWKSRKRCGNIVAFERDGEILVGPCNRRAPWSYTVSKGLTMHRCPECKVYLDVVETESRRVLTAALAKGTK
jgi:hypothetical protein